MVQKHEYCGAEVSQEASEIMHHTMEGLRVLKEEQDDLELWYKMEQVKLAERYDRMRLMNIQKQKSIIESSHDLLLTTSIDTTPLRQSHVRVNTPGHSDTGIDNSIKRTPPRSVTPHDNSYALRKRSFEASNNKYGENSPSQHQQIEDKLTQSQVVSSDISNGASFTHNNSPSPSIQHNNKKLIFEKPLFEQKPNGSQLVNEECELKVSITSNNPVSHSSQFHSNKLSSNTKETIGSEFVMRFHQSMDAKLRRKSRATKFFPTPEKKTLKSKLTDYKIESSPNSGENCFDNPGLSKSCGNTSVFGTPAPATVESHNMESLSSSLSKQREDANINNEDNCESLKMHSGQTNQYSESNLMVTPAQSLAGADSPGENANKRMSTLSEAANNQNMSMRKSLDSIKQHYDVSSINNVMKQIADSPGLPNIDGGLPQQDEKVRNQAASPLCLGDRGTCMTPTAASSSDLISTSAEKDNATSTPHEAINRATPYLDRFHHNLSFICGAEMPMVDYCNEVLFVISLP